MDIDNIIKTCITDSEARKALATRLKKTLLPWQEEPGVIFPEAGTQRYVRINLLGEIIARGQRTTRDKRASDGSLVEQGFILLNEEDLP